MTGPSGRGSGSGSGSGSGDGGPADPWPPTERDRDSDSWWTVGLPEHDSEPGLWWSDTVKHAPDADDSANGGGAMNPGADASGPGKINGHDGPAPKVVPTIGLVATLRLLLRRWPFVVLGIAIAELACVGVLKAVPASYTASGTLLLNVPQVASPSSRTDGGPTTTAAVNPYLGTRGFVGDVLVTVMADPDAEARVVQRGGTGTYKTALSLGDAALVKVDTTGATREEALRTWNATADETNAALIRLQKSKQVADPLLVTAEPLTRPLEAETESGSRIRALLVTIAFGIVLTVGLAYGAERYSLSHQDRPSRRERRAARGDTDEHAAYEPRGPKIEPGTVIVNERHATDEPATPRRRERPGSGSRGSG
jgi:hypothetical protein